MIRLVTLNTWKDEGDYLRRMSLIGSQLARLDADIICLQEVYSAGPDTQSSFEHVSGATGLAGFFTPARSKHRHGRLSSSGLAVLSRWPIRVAVPIALPSHPLDGERIAQCIDLETPAGPLRVVNLHLTHLMGAEADRLRADQLAKIHRRACKDWAQPIVFAGDFNAGPDAAALQTLLGQAGYQCSADRIDDPTTMMQGPASVIDLIVLWGAGRLTIQAAKTVLDARDPNGVSPSDHKGIMVTIAPGA